MVNHLKKIIPFIIIAILAAGGVETFYRMTFSRLMKASSSPKVQAAAAQVAAPISGVKKKGPGQQVILKRNLFGPPQGGKPAMTKQPIPDKLAATALELSLLGTIAGPPNARRAIILDKKKKAQDIYYQGDTIQGAVIKEIQRGKIILNVNGKDEILIPETPKSSTATTTPGFPGLVPPETAQEPPPDMPAENVMEPEPIEPTVNNTVEPNAIEADSQPADRPPPIFSVPKP